MRISSLLPFIVIVLLSYSLCQSYSRRSQTSLRLLNPVNFPKRNRQIKQKGEIDLSRRLVGIDMVNLRLKVSEIQTLEQPYSIDITDCSVCSSNIDSCTESNICNCKSDPQFYGKDCSINETTFEKIKNLKIQVLDEILNNKQSLTTSNVEQILDIICQLTLVSQTIMIDTVDKIHEITNLCVKLSTQANFQKMLKVISDLIDNLLIYHGQQELMRVCRTSKRFLNRISESFTDDKVIQMKQKNLAYRVGPIDSINSNIANQKYFSAQTRVNNKLMQEVLVDGVPIGNQNVLIGNIQFFLDIRGTQSDLKSTFYTIKMFKNGKQIKVKNLSRDAQVEFKFQVNNSQYFKKIKKLIYDTVPINNFDELTQRKQQILKQHPIEFRYWDKYKGWCTDGVRFVDFTEEYVIGKTNHLTDFAGFVGESIAVLENSNHGVFNKMIHLTGKNFVNNIGFQIIAMLWVLYIVILIMMLVLEKQQRAKITRLETRKDLMRKRTFQFESEMTSNFEQSPAHGIRLNLQPASQKFGQKQSPPSQGQTQRVIDSESGFTSKANKMLKLNKILGSAVKQLKIRRKSTSKSDIPEPTAKSRWRKLGFVAKAVQRLQSMRVQNSAGRTLGKSIYSQIKHNNMLLNMFIKQSVVFPRSARTTVFFMAMILQVFLVALFYQVTEGPEISMKKQFMQNFWVGFWSVLFSIIPILITVCLFTMPSKRRNQIVGTQTEDDFDKQLKKQTRKMKARYAIAYTISILVMIFTSWYVVAFGAWVGDLQSTEFLTSSLVAVFVDGILLEILSALVVGIVITLVFKWKCMKFLYCFPILIEIYRIYRNMAGD